MLSLELYEKTSGSQNYAYVFLKNEMNVFLLIMLVTDTKILFIICFCFFSFFGYQKQILNIKTTEIHAACHTLDNLWTFLTTVYQQREKNWQKTKGFALMLASNAFIVIKFLNRNSYLLAKC